MTESVIVPAVPAAVPQSDAALGLGARGPGAVAPLSRGSAVAFVVGYFGIWLAFFSPIVIIVPMKVEQLAPGGKASALSLILGGSAVFGILAPPIAGRLSDRCTSRFGRRRPFLLGSMALGMVGLVGEAFAGSLLVFFVAFSLGAIAFGVGVAVSLAVLPEHVPVDRRGKVSGFLGIAQSFAVVIGVGVTGAVSTVSLAAAFVVPGLAGFVLVVWMVTVLPDRVISDLDRPPLSLRSIFGSFWVSPRHHPDFGWAWLSRFAIFMAFSGTVNYQVFFLRDQLGVAEDRTSALVAAGTGLQVVMVIGSSALTGFLSDRNRRRKIFAVVAALLGVVGLVLIAFTPGLPLYFVGLAVIGLGQGAYYAVDLALIADLLPEQRDDDARKLGVFSLANQVPTSVAPAIAPVFLAVGYGASAGADNYTALFLGSAVFAAVAAVTVARVSSAR